MDDERKQVRNERGGAFVPRAGVSQPKPREVGWGSAVTSREETARPTASEQSQNKVSADPFRFDVT